MYILCVNLEINFYIYVLYYIIFLSHFSIKDIYVFNLNLLKLRGEVMAIIKGERKNSNYTIFEGV